MAWTKRLMYVAGLTLILTGCARNGKFLTSSGKGCRS